MLPLDGKQLINSSSVTCRYSRSSPEMSLLSARYKLTSNRQDSFRRSMKSLSLLGFAFDTLPPLLPLLSIAISVRCKSKPRSTCRLRGHLLISTNSSRLVYNARAMVLPSLPLPTRDAMDYSSMRADRRDYPAS